MATLYGLLIVPLLLAPGTARSDAIFNDLWIFSSEANEPGTEWKAVNCKDGPVHRQTVEPGQHYTFRIVDCFCGTRLEVYEQFADFVADAISEVARQVEDKLRRQDGYAFIPDERFHQALQEAIDEGIEGWASSDHNRHIATSRVHDVEMLCKPREVRQEVMCWDASGLFPLFLQLLEESGQFVHDRIMAGHRGTAGGRKDYEAWRQQTVKAVINRVDAHVGE